MWGQDAPRAAVCKRGSRGQCSLPEPRGLLNRPYERRRQAQSHVELAEGAQGSRPGELIVAIITESRSRTRTRVMGFALKWS